MTFGDFLGGVKCVAFEAAPSAVITCRLPIVQAQIEIRRCLRLYANDIELRMPIINITRMRAWNAIGISGPHNLRGNGRRLHRLSAHDLVCGAQIIRK
jgi:hypothetical protein